MSEPIIGIDLGTSTTVVSEYRDGAPVAIPDPESKTPLMPSAVARDKAGRTLVGKRALDRPGVVVEAKRAMGTETRFALGNDRLRAQDVAAEILRKAKGYAEAALGRDIRRVVVTVPALFGDRARAATQEAIRLAGLECVRILNEPTAAALAFGLANQGYEGTLLVFDWGGGTLDATVLETIEGVLDVKASFGDAYLGGKDADAAVAAWLRARFDEEHPGAALGPDAERALLAAAKDAKETLSSTDATLAEVPNFASRGGRELDLEVPIAREELEAILRPLIGKAMRVTDETLARAGLGKEAITDVLPVGGSTWTPAVREALRAHFPGANLLIGGINPDLAVSAGAAISAASAMASEDGSIAAPRVVAQDVCNRRLGLSLMDVVAGVPTKIFRELVPQNAKIPYTYRSDEFTLMRPDQTELAIALYEDATGVARFIEDAVETRIAGRITGIPRAADGRPRTLEIAFSYDQNQRARLVATVMGTGHALTLEETASEAPIVAPTLAQPPVQVPPVVPLPVTSPLLERNRALLARAADALTADPGAVPGLSEAVAALNAAIARDDATGAGVARGRVIDLLASL